jgi:hypothetical protein
MSRRQFALFLCGLLAVSGGDSWRVTAEETGIAILQYTGFAWKETLWRL